MVVAKKNDAIEYFVVQDITVDADGVVNDINEALTVLVVVVIPVNKNGVVVNIKEAVESSLVVDMVVTADTEPVVDSIVEEIKV